LAINPWGQVPVLQDGSLALRDSQAIVAYLARKFCALTWLPEDARAFGQVMQWLSFAEHD
jgi:glutathione S-transferase